MCKLGLLHIFHKLGQVLGKRHQLLLGLLGHQLLLGLLCVLGSLVVLKLLVLQIHPVVPLVLVVHFLPGHLVVLVHLELLGHRIRPCLPWPPSFLEHQSFLGNQCLLSLQFLLVHLGVLDVLGILVHPLVLMGLVDREHLVLLVHRYLLPLLVVLGRQ